MKRVALILMGLLMLAVLPSSVAAGPSPGVHYERSELTYIIDENLAVRAQLEFTLLNQTGSSRSREESRAILTPDVTDIEVQDSLGGRVNYTVQQSPENTVIQIDYVIYPSERLNYTISYKAQGLVSKDGPKYRLKYRLGGMSVREGGWPHDNFIVTVQGPPDAQLFLYEPTEDVTISGENIRYEKTQLEPPFDFDGVSGTWYASPAYYEINLERSISNPGPDKTDSLQFDVILFNTEDNWQFCSLVSSTPTLETMYVDEENNWHGVFEIGAIEPNETREFQLKLIYQGDVHDPGITADSVGEFSDVPMGLGEYLKPLQYWENSQVIQDAASSVVGTETNVYLAAKSIVNFVADHLTYDDTFEYRGAVQAYQRENGDCSNYTDLSIALARAAGIPARASYGWAYSENDIAGHAWLELYLPDVGWQPADPTWADTSGDYFGRLDPIHIQRSLRGLGSTEGYMTYTYRGNKPSLPESSEEIAVLTKAEAADDFLSAAEFAIDLASNLLESEGGGENLNQELSQARSFLEQAENVSDADQRLALSQLAVQHANVVIQELGKPPAGEEEPFISLQNLLLVTAIIVVIIALSGGIWYAIRKKAERSSISSWS